MIALPPQNHGLAVLRVGYRDGRGTPGVICRLDSPHDAPITWEFPAFEIGLGSDPGRPRQQFDLAVQLDPVAEMLRNTPTTVVLRQAHEALWLQFLDDHPLLPAIDWENGLRKLDVPVLRLPAHPTAPPPPPARTPCVALCVTMPVAKDPYPAIAVVQQVVTEMDAALAVLPEIHVFADAALWADLQATVGERAAVHHPESEGPHNPEGQPWLEWISRVLGERSTDVLHLIGHGYLGVDQGAFASAETPTLNFDKGSARFIWPQQLATALTRTGAWGLICSAVPGNFSRAGLRLLTYQAEAVRAAATIFHDFETAADSALADIYRLLLQYPVALPASTAGLAMRAHPARFGIEVVRSGYQPRRTELADLVDSGAEVPGPLVGAQRQIRELEAQLSFESSAPRVESARAGLELAKTRLDALLRQTGDVEELP